MGTARTQAKKLNWFRNRFDIAKQQGIDLELNKTLAMFCIDNNSTKRTAMELLRNFELLDEIKLHKESIQIL